MAAAVARRFVAALGAILLAGETAQAQTSPVEDLFDPGVLHEIRLFINSRDLQTLRERWTDNTYYPADVHVRGTRIRNAGVRSRGNGSRNGSKLGLRIDFNRYVTGQTLGGAASVVLDNLWQDPSMIRERVAMAFFARMGQPAPRESFARVYINEVYQGTYAVVESIESSFLSRTLGTDSGVLFEYRWLAPYYLDDLGDDLAAYQPWLQLENHRSDALATTYGPVRELVRAVNQPLDIAWVAGVDPYVDLRQFVTHAAIEAFLAELDGVIGYAGMNNFYVYRLPGSSRHQFIPWDRDHAFETLDASVFQRVHENQLLKRALGTAELRALYLDVLEQCARAASDGGWLEREMLDSAATIAQSAAEDPLKPYSNEVHDAAVAFLIEFARRRPALVRAEVGRARCSGPAAGGTC